MRFTSPSGTTYTWDDSRGQPQQSDIDAIVAFDAQSHPPAPASQGKSLTPEQINSAIQGHGYSSQPSPDEINRAIQGSGHTDTSHQQTYTKYSPSQRRVLSLQIERRRQALWSQGIGAEDLTGKDEGPIKQLSDQDLDSQLQGINSAEVVMREAHSNRDAAEAASKNEAFHKIGEAINSTVGKIARYTSPASFIPGVGDFIEHVGGGLASGVNPISQTEFATSAIMDPLGTASGVVDSINKVWRKTDMDGKPISMTDRFDGLLSLGGTAMALHGFADMVRGGLHGHEFNEAVAALREKGIPQQEIHDVVAKQEEPAAAPAIVSHETMPQPETQPVPVVTKSAKRSGAKTPQVEGVTPNPIAEPTQKGAADVPGAEGATGLANQVQAKQVITGILDKVEPTAGRTPEEWQSLGKSVVEDGTSPDADFESLASRIAKGDDVAVTGQRIGVLLEGDRRLLNDVNQAMARLDADKGNPKLIEALDAARERRQNYLQDVQVAKGQWSDVGRALQAGTTLDYGNPAQVLEEVARRHPDTPQRVLNDLKDKSEQIGAARVDGTYPEGSLNRRITDLQDEIKNLKNDPFSSLDEVPAKSRSKGSGPTAIRAEIDSLWQQYNESKSPTAGVGKSKRRGAVTRVTLEDVRAAGDRAAILAKIVQSHVRLFAAEISGRVGAEHIEGFINHMRDEFLKRGLDVDRSAIVELSSASTRKLSELNNQLLDAQAQRRHTESQLKAGIKELGKPMLQKAAEVSSQIVQSTVLGTDLGQLTRQGLFTWVRPKAAWKGVKSGARALLSENNLARIEMDITDREINGKRVAPLRKAAGLSLTDSITHPEELSIGRLISKIPGVGKLLGKPLERAQLAFINTARAEVFDAGVRAGFSRTELATRARFINAATGRGNIKSVPNLLKAVLTSPRYEASRWQTIFETIRSPYDLAKGVFKGQGINRGAVANIQDMALTATAIAGVYKLAGAAGYSVNFDPTSADFLKMRRGKEIWDVSAGLAPRLRDIMRIYVAWGHPEFNHTMGDVLAGAGVRTISPAVRIPLTQASFAKQRSEGASDVKDPFTGFGAGPGDEGVQSLTPLIYQSTKQAYDEEGPSAAFGAFLKELVGSNVNRYSNTGELNARDAAFKRGEGPPLSTGEANELARLKGESADNRPSRSRTKRPPSESDSILKSEGRTRSGSKRMSKSKSGLVN